MKTRLTGIIMALLSMAIFLVPAPVKAVTLTIGPTSGPVDTIVTIYALNTYGMGDYAIYWGESKQLLKQGSVEGYNTTTFTVPESPRGPNKLYLKVGSNNYETEFRVTPSLFTSPANGIVGTLVTVTGRGFNALETAVQVTYDGSVAEAGIDSDSRGSWKRTFKIPPSRYGKHALGASGATPAIEVAEQSFTVIPRIEILPVSGGVDTMVTVEGTGFGSSETGVTLTYDSTVIKAGIATDARGSWKSSFFVPRSAQGRHSVDAYGSLTKSNEVEDLSFTVAPSLKIEMAAGYLGDAIRSGDPLWASGIGFQENETGIRITFDGTMLASGIIADSKGTWATRLELPQATRGQHSIAASGDITRVGDVPGATIIISPSLEINPNNGAIGDTVAVKGTGYSGSQPITINFDGTQVASGTNSDSRGSFSTNFKVQPGKAGNHTITVTDSKSVISSAFTVEATAPPVPAPVTPLPGTAFSFTGKPVYFEWTASSDPSGVTYQIEISKTFDFSVAILRRSNVAPTGFTIDKNDTLPSGTYFWRVKAVDGAGNESAWTSGQMFKVEGIDTWMIMAAVVLLILLALVIWRIIHISRRGGWG